MSDLDQSNESGMWYVQFAGDVVRAMTLEQLDAAFQSGVIGEETLVRQDGETQWSRLAQIAGIEAPVESSAIGPESIRPVVFDSADHDLDTPIELRPRRRGAVAIAVAALMLLGGVGFVATKYSGASSKAGPVVAASQPVVTSPVVALPANLTAAISDAHLGDQSIPQEAKLSDAQKKMVLDADKKREKQLEEKRAKMPHPKKRTPGGAVFHTGGNVHDPLNSSIGGSSK